MNMFFINKVRLRQSIPNGITDPLKIMRETMNQKIPDSFSFKAVKPVEVFECICR